MNTVVRKLYPVYRWFIFTPYLIISTFIFGLTAAALCFFMDPKLPSRICGAGWARLNGLLTPMFVTVRGRENIDPEQSYVIAVNHRSQYDVLLLYGWLGIDFKWVMKKELRKVPIIGISCEKLGHIFIDRTDRNAAIRSINEAKKKIRNGTSVLFFPEGTRSRSGKMLPFKKGAFKMALDLGLPILPLSILGTREILPPDTKDIFPGKAELIIHPPVSIAGYDDENLEALMEKVKNIIAGPLDE
ncbi:MAG: lysophospholipid acyltransferase family protein [Desulfococcaceae bacterium]|nr:lysophospholipid acyltransferase family protein [Desulfococcaceae bacterium]